MKTIHCITWVLMFLNGWPARADNTPLPSTEETALDASMRRGIRQHRLESDFEALNDVRRETMDAYMWTEGHRFTLSLPLMVQFNEQDVPGFSRVMAANKL